MTKVARRWTAGEWMTDIAIAIRPHITVGSAHLKMRVAGFRHLLVIDKGHLMGIVTDRDLRRHDVPQELEGWEDLYDLDDERPVFEVMTTDIRTVSAETPLRDVVSLFLQFKFGAMPVVDGDGHVEGILTQHDVMRATRELLEASGGSD